MSTQWKPDQQDSAVLTALGLASPDESASAPEELVTGLREAARVLAESVAPVPPSLPSTTMKFG
jgi:hypothetical protein